MSRANTRFLNEQTQGGSVNEQTSATSYVMGTEAEGAAPRLLALADLLPEWEEDAAARNKRRESGIPMGAVTGLPSLDEQIGGLLEPGLHVLHGAPGTGKTALALQIGADCGAPCLYVTCEMAPLELLRRLTARRTGTYLGKLKSGELRPEESKALAARTVRECAHLAFLDASRAYASPAFIQEASRAIRQENPHLLVVIDHVHSWAAGAAGDATEYEALNLAVQALRQVAGNLGCPILGIAERNRVQMKTGGLNAAAGSRKFEYCAETVLDLSAPEGGKPDAATGEKAIEVRLEKNRNGAAGQRLELLFSGRLQRFREPDVSPMRAGSGRSEIDFGFGRR